MERTQAFNGWVFGLTSPNHFNKLQPTNGAVFPPGLGPGPEEAAPFFNIRITCMLTSSSVRTIIGHPNFTPRFTVPSAPCDHQKKSQFYLWLNKQYDIIAAVNPNKAIRKRQIDEGADARRQEEDRSIQQDA